MIEAKALAAAIQEAGMDPVQFQKDLDESGDAFAKQFERDDPNFHNGNTTAVPTGGSRVPESMGGASAPDWRDLSENQLSIEPEYPPEYHTAMAQYEIFGKIKKCISVLNKPVENAYKVRLQYKGCEGDDKVAMESRLKGEEKLRDGALDAGQALFGQLDQTLLSDRAKSTIQEVMERGRFPFEDRDTLGDYMTVLQRGNQALFADQKKLLEKIKKIKKEAAAAANAAAAKVDAVPPAAVDVATAGA
jgi:hypothetical protein